MNPKTIQKLQYFVGKICTIMTDSVNRSFDERTARRHFVVIVQSIDSDGLWGHVPDNQELVFFFRLDHVISIHEEYELNPNNPEDAAIIEEFEKRTGNKIKSDLEPIVKEKKHQPKEDLLPVVDVSKEPVGKGDATFVDIASLERLAMSTKRSFAMDEAFVANQPFKR